MNRNAIRAVVLAMLVVTAALAGGIATAQQNVADVNTSNVSSTLNASGVSVQQSAPDSRPGSGQLIETIDAGESGTIGDLSERYSKYDGYVYVEAHGAPGEGGDSASGSGGEGGQGGYVGSWLTQSDLRSNQVCYQAGDLGGGQSGSGGYEEGGDGGGSTYFDHSCSGATNIEGAGGGGGGGAYNDAGPAGDGESGGNGEGIEAPGGEGGRGGTAGTYDAGDGGVGGTHTNGYSYAETGSSPESNGVVKVYAPQVHDPGVSGASYNDGTLTVDIQDDDLGYAWGDEFNVSVYRSSNDELIGEKTFTDDSPTFDTSIDGVEDVYVETEDLGGNTDTSDDITMYGAATLTIRNETTADPIDDTTISVTSYPDDPDGEITEFETSDGRINMTGLDPTDTYTFAMSASGYSERTTVITNPGLEQSAYLLPDTGVSTVETRFILDDVSGQFDENSRLVVSRAIELDNQTEYRQVTADQFGSEGFQATLEENVRYRIAVRNPDGTTQDIGPYRASTSETVTIVPGSPAVGLDPGDDGWLTSATIDNDTITARYLDDEELTDSVTLTVYERGNESNVVFAPTTYPDANDVATAISLTANQTDTEWVVEWEITRDGEAFTSTQLVANQRGTGFSGLDGKWSSAIAIFILVLFAGAFSVVNRAAGAIMTGLMGGLLWWFGWLSGITSAAAIALYLFVAIVYSVYLMQRP